jgi:phthalate 4,5-dioxygenase oxygenase subunit
MLRECYWVPAVRKGRVEADGAPVRVRLFGENFVVFRATDGRVGFLDEACPHRRASLALARNQDCALQCIFHGWKIHVTGKVIATPNEAREPERFASRVKVNHYPTREAGGMIWVYLGQQAEPPPFPNFEFNGLRDDQVNVVSVVIPCNWAQGVEASIDDAHVAILHASFMPDYKAARPHELDAGAPAYDVELRPYGFQATAVRSLPGGRILASATHFAMPWYGFVSTGAPDSAGHERRTVFVAVPIDDRNYHQVFFSYDVSGPVTKFFAGVSEYSQDNFAPPLGGPETYWGQDREAMQNGHATGFPSNLIAEDTAVQISMGRITDRTRETLCTSDKAIGYARQMLLQAARDFQNGKTPQSARPNFDLNKIRARTAEATDSEDWRELVEPRAAATSVTLIRT